MPVAVFGCEMDLMSYSSYIADTAKIKTVFNEKSAQLSQVFHCSLPFLLLLLIENHIFA